MNVSLTPELEHLVHEKVQSGFYNSASEVIREALRLLNDRDTLQKQRMDELRQEVSIGLEELKQGKSVPGEQVFEELRRLSKTRRGTTL